MTTIQRLQNWYSSQCDGDWEHGSGVKIETLDNPGWSVCIDLAGTDLENHHFTPTEYHVGPDSNPKDHDWWTVKIEDTKFVGWGGPHHLETLLKAFLEWAEK